MSVKLTQKHINASFDAPTLARANSYFKQKMVSEWGIEGKTSSKTSSEIYLNGVTRGSGSNVYHQSVTLTEYNKRVAIEGYCSCPVELDCKHVAAVCMEYLNSDGQPSKVVSARRAPTRDGLSQELNDWLSDLSGDTGTRNYNQDEPEDFLVYLLQPSSLKHFQSKQSRHISTAIKATRPKKSGKGFIKGRDLNPSEVIEPASRYGCNIEQADLDIAYLLAGLDNHYRWMPEVELRHRSGALALEQMVATGRCYWRSVESGALSIGPKLAYSIDWRETEGGQLELVTNLGSSINLVLCDPPMYIDVDKGQIGELENQHWSSDQLEELMSAPQLDKSQIEPFTDALLKRFPGLALPFPTDIDIIEVNDAKPLPMLTLSQFYLPEHDKSMHCLRLNFDYAGHEIEANPENSVYTTQLADGWLRIQRDLDEEHLAQKILFDLGFETMRHRSIKGGAHYLFSPENAPSSSITRWADLIDNQLDTLAELDWQIEQEDNFALRFQEAEWDSSIVDDLDEEGNPNPWFSLRFDLTFEGRKIPLAPVVESALHNLAQSAELPEHFILAVGENRYVKLPSERLRPILNTLTELLDRVSVGEEGEFTLSKYDAGALNDLLRQDIVIQGGKHLQQLAQQLHDFSNIKEVEIPQNLLAELRPYQHAGLNWLQFLRQYEFNGILADDMGLGKTVQALAHILLEKNAGRMYKPALIIAPTSLVGNWRAESHRFTPSLKTLVWHGAARHSLYDQIEGSDIVITTYPLVTRDQEKLALIDYQMVVLDEAQTTKNSTTKLAKAVRKLNAQQRLCLTGTPLENNLGELWALFDFLMPGFLGNRKEFNRIYRSPIEKQSDVEQQQKLARRIQPFLLRRLKTEVADDLPAKTVITQNVVFEETQAELYESIRISMDEKVRAVIAAQGMAKSHITILDALLKLRQVCCDPRLLKLTSAVHTQRSAKLEMLMQMLPEQIAEGRKVLLFSQFTSMLSLIEDELNEEGIHYTKLTGQTTKREEAVERFRSGEVNLFLISLKAGGVGLNLTEADTVIIYDPWWNPAAETQAIDRAHRIGQDKPIFVYKLVTENTVEEKMLEMQERKRALADGVIDANASGQSNLLIDPDTLRSLFEPIQRDAADAQAG